MRWTDVHEADEMALDFEITREEWINRLVHLGHMTVGDAEAHATALEGTHRGARLRPRRAAYPVTRRRFTEAM